ncbi:MAG: hypothetical protein ACXVFM_05665 [Solirubrobacteraceae bacterium]
MQREDESLSTRDLAGTQREVPVETAAEPATEDPSPAEQDACFERRPANAEADADAPAGHSSQATADKPTEPQVAATQGDADHAGGIDEAGSLLPDGEESDFQHRWEEIQTRFVDDPRQAVEDADALVAGVMQRIAEGFAQARDGLEGQWSRGEDVGTEELRVALQRYRAFFRRLLSA